MKETLACPGAKGASYSEFMESLLEDAFVGNLREKVNQAQKIEDKPKEALGA
jgi:hypothetical protein